MSIDPHVQKVLDSDFPYADKSNILGKVVCVLNTRSAKRGMELTPHPSRAVCQHEVHELILTDEVEAGPNKTVNNVCYVAFFEITTSGLLTLGDKVEVDGREIGKLVGFDYTHMPNHINILVKADAPLRSGLESGVKVGSEVKFTLKGK
jgi:hypothetical protein